MKFISVFILTVTVIFAKNPAFILYDDGTWQKAGGGNYDLSSSFSGNSLMGSLEVHASLKMQRGGAKPVSSEDVFLTTKSAKQMVLETGYSQPLESHESYIDKYSWFCTYPHSDSFIQIGRAVVAGLEKYTVQEEITDLQGKAEFIGIKPGKYYVILRTSLGADWGCAWSVPIEVKRGRNKIILRNENLGEDLLHAGETLSTSAPSSSPSFETPPTPPPLPDNLNLEATANVELDNWGNAGSTTYEEELAKIQSDFRSKKISSEVAIERLNNLKKRYNR